MLERGGKEREVGREGEDRLARVCPNCQKVTRGVLSRPKSQRFVKVDSKKLDQCQNPTLLDRNLESKTVDLIRLGTFRVLRPCPCVRACGQGVSALVHASGAG
jgi:hypothetical protein